MSGVTDVNGSHKHNTGLCWWSLSRDSYDKAALARDFMDDELVYYDTNAAGNHTHNVTTKASTTNGQGGGKAHTHTIPNTNSSSNIPLYITCYMWKRTA